MTPLDHLKGIWGLSLCIWGIFSLFISFRIQKFIVKRYEQETNLLDTIYFQEHATFTRYIPNFFSSAMYTAHLITFIWGWKTFRKRKAYRDLKTKEADYVLKHFSDKEIRLVKTFIFSSLIVIIHGIIYYGIKFLHLVDL